MQNFDSHSRCVYTVALGPRVQSGSRLFRVVDIVSGRTAMRLYQQRKTAFTEFPWRVCNHPAFMATSFTNGRWMTAASGPCRGNRRFHALAWVFS